MGELAISTKHPLRSFAKELRNNSTDVERLLWHYLKNSQLEGVKFRRQQPIETYIVDFVSLDKKIIIELDGGQHAENIASDARRDACLRANGLVVLRFWNNDIIENIEGGFGSHQASVFANTFPHPLTPSRTGRGDFSRNTNIRIFFRRMYCGN